MANGTGVNVMIGTASVSTVQALGEAIRTIAFLAGGWSINESQAGYIAVLLAPFILHLYHKLGNGHSQPGGTT